MLQGLWFVEGCCLCLQQTVTEEKFSILFQSQFSVGGGELVFQVWVSVNFFFINIGRMFMVRRQWVLTLSCHMDSKV